MLKRLTYSTFIAMLFISVSARAGLVSISGYEFIDNGISTIDKKTGIEWLDINLTTDRSYNDILHDITYDGGKFAKSEGWRFAEKEDLFRLFSAVFDVNFTGTTIRFSGQEHEVNVFSFINLFGDGFVTESDARGFVRLDPRSNSAAGYSIGFVSQPDDPSVLETVMIADSEFYVLDREANPHPYYYDDQDYIHLGRLTGSTPDYDYREMLRDPAMGAWLIRDSKTIAVHEPHTAILFITMIFALVVRRRFCDNRRKSFSVLFTRSS
ncbi:MAG TPA: hypothetical protein VL995_02945 [Cellvibrio sp.]|nr:hypothetical protein [Cellvibrio sp.]